MSDVSIRPPKQERSRQSFERVIEAAVQLLDENGFETFTVQDVSQRADVSVGAIYERFGNKESLLRAVHRHVMESLQPAHDAIGEVDPGELKSAQEAIIEAVRRLAGAFRGNERVLRAFMHLGAVDEQIAALGSERSRDLAHRFETAILACGDEITHREPELAADIAYRMAYCTFARQVMYGSTFESERAVTWEGLVDEVGAACAAYLLQQPHRTKRKPRSS